jgi:hypothetical protein
MDINKFWQIVEAARDAAGADGDARVGALRERLSALPPAELQDFQDHYDLLHDRAYRWDLWAAAYIMNGGCSDDGFHYFRDWLISEGRQTYEAALRDPESLADLGRVEMVQNESYGYVASELFDEAGAGEIELGRLVPEGSSEPAGERWYEDAVNSIYPRLAAKYTW